MGRGIRGRSRADEHEAVLAEVAAIAADREVDLVLVAGDLFDTAAPTPEAEATVYRALLDLVATGAEVVLVAGNHDSWRRLRAVAPLLDLTRVHTGAALARPDDGGVLRLATRSGEEARVALLPWVSQRGIVRADELMRDDADEHGQAYADRVSRIVELLCAPFAADTVNLVVAHLMVAGGQVGGGERSAHTVFDYCVPALAFPATAHYVALGHLHRTQQVPGRCPVWYSGSPLQLDFGEEDEDKHVLVVEAAPGRPARVEAVPLTAGRRLRTLRGPLDALAARADDAGDDHLRVVVEGPRRAGLAEQVRELFPAAVEVVLADPDVDRATDDDLDLRDLTTSPAELLARYLSEQDAADERVEALFRELLEDHHAPDPA